MDDIEIVVDNIFEGDALATAVKFDKGVYKIDIGHAGSRSQAGNLNFNTAIKATPGARGGQAPVAMVLKLLKHDGSGITFINDHNKLYQKNTNLFYQMKRILKKGLLSSLFSIFFNHRYISAKIVTGK